MTYGGNVDTDDQWWGLVTTLSHVVDQALDAAGRERHTLSRYLNIRLGADLLAVERCHLRGRRGSSGQARVHRRHHPLAPT